MRTALFEYKLDLYFKKNHENKQGEWGFLKQKTNRFRPLQFVGGVIGRN